MIEILLIGGLVLVVAASIADAIPPRELELSLADPWPFAIGGVRLPRGRF